MRRTAIARAVVVEAGYEKVEAVFCSVSRRLRAVPPHAAPLGSERDPGSSVGGSRGLVSRALRHNSYLSLTAAASCMMICKASQL